ncbi:MAG TPA: alpha-galactosidase [Actinomycetota bacterium]|nr:alpha-galactosidase [Actinomycetota bacterium]
MLRRLVALSLVVLFLAALTPGVLAQDSSTVHRSGTAYVEVTDDRVVVGNALVERAWSRGGWANVSYVDKRGGNQVAGASGPDFTLDVGTASIPGDSFDATAVSVEEIPGGLRAEVSLAPVEGVEPALAVTRIVEVYEGVAGVRTETVIETPAPVVLRGYVLDQVAVGDEVAATIHAFRAGADWREPNWPGPQGSIGDPHAGTWRDSDGGAPGEAIAGPAQWISARRGDGSLFMVMERNDWPSSRAGYSAGAVRLQVDYSADVVILGPIEEQGHVENPRAGELPGRHRVLRPGVPYATEPAFTGFGSDPDDEPWQFYKYLSEHRLEPYDHEVTFNSNGTDADVRSEGAKDDMVEEVVVETAPIAKRLGIETFILDDGWQARSGDWVPDCGTAPGEPNTDPRWDGTPATDKFRPRFSDCDFSAVRDAIAPMELGLWMSPMHFHPRSSTYTNHPDWSCKPVGDVTGAISLLQPSGGSNDAGLGTWSSHARLMDHVQARIQTAIDDWGVTYFKFDFLVWLDCAGTNDLYEYKEAFLAMLDELIAANPGVTFQIDETNDYRLFPFESVARGPSWFQNGSPAPDRLLHNVWNLSPFVPAYSLGQHFLGGNHHTRYPVDTLMAAALPTHLTFFSDLRRLPEEVVAQARPWVDFYAEHREHFSQMTYPLLDDPIEGGWTALQPWNPEEGVGALLAFRQGSADETVSIPLRNVPPGMTFELFEGPTGAPAGTVTSEDLVRGLEITIPARDGARVLLIRPAEPGRDRATQLVYDGTTRTRVGGAATLSATLTGAEGPIEGALLTFAYRGRTFEATTGPDGRAVALAKAKQLGPPGPYEVVVSYAGSELYDASQTTATIELVAGTG